MACINCCGPFVYCIICVNIVYLEPFSVECNFVCFFQYIYTHMVIYKFKNLTWYTRRVTNVLCCKMPNLNRKVLGFFFNCLLAYLSVSQFHLMCSVRSCFWFMDTSPQFDLDFDQNSLLFLRSSFI